MCSTSGVAFVVETNFESSSNRSSLTADRRLFSIVINRRLSNTSSPFRDFGSVDNTWHGIGCFHNAAVLSIMLGHGIITITINNNVS